MNYLNNTLIGQKGSPIPSLWGTRVQAECLLVHTLGNISSKTPQVNFSLYPPPNQLLRVGEKDLKQDLFSLTSCGIVFSSTEMFQFSNRNITDHACTLEPLTEDFMQFYRLYFVKNWIYVVIIYDTMTK